MELLIGHDSRYQENLYMESDVYRAHRQPATVHAAATLVITGRHRPAAATTQAPEEGPRRLRRVQDGAAARDALGPQDEVHAGGTAARD